MDVRLRKISSEEKILFEGHAENIAFEINGDLKDLTKKFRTMYDGPLSYIFNFLRRIFSH